MDVPFTNQRMEIQSSRHSGECRNPVEQRVAKGDTLLDWIPGQARYDDWGYTRYDDEGSRPRRHSGIRRNDGKIDSCFRRNGKGVLERQFVLTTGPSWRVASCS